MGSNPAAPTRDAKEDAIGKWSLDQGLGRAGKRRPWHRDPAVLAETLKRVPVGIGGVLGMAAIIGFLAWLGVPAIVDAAGAGAWGTAIFRVVWCVLGIVFCGVTGFLVGKAFTSLLIRGSLRLADSRFTRVLEAKWESFRTQPPERRY